MEALEGALMQPKTLAQTLLGYAQSGQSKTFSETKLALDSDGCNRMDYD